MKRATNFSVPDTGKTTMIYGTFAYLSSTRVNEVDKLLTASPLNTIAAWRAELQ